MSEEIRVEQSPAIGISFSCDVGGGQNLVFQTHIDRSANVEWINTLLDKLVACSDRQMARIALSNLEHQRNLKKATLLNMTEDFLMIEAREQKAAADWVNSGRRGDWKRPEKEEVHRQQMKNALDQAQAQVQEYERLIEEAKKKAA